MSVEVFTEFCADRRRHSAEGAESAAARYRHQDVAIFAYRCPAAGDGHWHLGSYEVAARAAVTEITETTSRRDP